MFDICVIAYPKIFLKSFTFLILLAVGLVHISPLERASRRL